MTDQITTDQFFKVEMRVGKVIKAEDVEKSEKLIKLTADFGEFGQRIIFTGVRTYGYTASDFQDKQFLFVVNIPYRKMMGEESQGMILAVEDDGGKPIFISGEGLPVGAKVK